MGASESAASNWIAGQEAHAAIASAMAGHSYKKSAHRGVSANWSRWRAQIYVGGRRNELGSFATEAEAARAYDRAAIMHVPLSLPVFAC